MSRKQNLPALTFLGEQGTNRKECVHAPIVGLLHSLLGAHVWDLDSVCTRTATSGQLKHLIT